MCGIVGYIGDKDAAPIIFDGLRKLEYRGYDSAGMAIVQDGQLATRKSAGKLNALGERLETSPLQGNVGIGHTRWATHGSPSDANAHPHTDGPGDLAIVHNGIIENYVALRKELAARGVEFRSETDSETLAHLIRHHYNGNLADAVRAALRKVEGAYGLAVVAADDPTCLIAARQGSPLVVGLGDDEAFIASDVPAILKHTRRVLYLANGDVAEVCRSGCSLSDIDGNAREGKIETVEWDDAAVEKDGFLHFMMKEIHQQPDLLRQALQQRFDSNGELFVEELQDVSDMLTGIRKIHIVACGTAWHAGLVGKRLLENIARVPVEIDLASEFRYRDPLIDSDTLVIPVSQSGETADTLEALRIAQDRGAPTLAVVNVIGSSMTREAQTTLYINAGTEIGVASTKAYTSQITSFLFLALHMGRLRDTLPEERRKELTDALRSLPQKMQQCLENQTEIERLAHDPKYRDPRSAFFMGRGYNYPSALEGALKLKEISYIHAEGYAAGEMKHGPIALITPEVPMIAIATQSPVYEKTLSNIQEIRARKGVLLALATEGDTAIHEHVDDVLFIPECPDELSPILNAIPLQLLSYHIATNRGCDVDQPRNLAKSVTVE